MLLVQLMSSRHCIAQQRQTIRRRAQIARASDASWSAIFANSLHRLARARKASWPSMLATERAEHDQGGLRDTAGLFMEGDADHAVALPWLNILNVARLRASAHSLNTHAHDASVAQPAFDLMDSEGGDTFDVDGVSVDTAGCSCGPVAKTSSQHR